MITKEAQSLMKRNLIIFLLLSVVVLSSQALGAEPAVVQFEQENGTLTDGQLALLVPYGLKLVKAIRRHWFPPKDGAIPTFTFDVSASEIAPVQHGPPPILR